MTRPITPHKGGRTCRAPDARMTPQAREMLREVLAAQGVNYADWLEKHIETDRAKLARKKARKEKDQEVTE